MTRETLDRLTDALVENILTTPDSEILEEAREEWFPFKTAPKDGTPFLAYWMRTYSDGTRYEAAQGYVVAHYMDGRVFPSWIDTDDLPTHWQALPVPPKT